MTEQALVPKMLAPDLRMRRATPDDADRLCDFNARIHGDDPADGQAVAVWTRDLLCKPHPSFTPGDFLIVESTETGEIVSSLNTISQTWSYGGIPFGVGRPELVGTDSAYRGRGLVRAQFDVVHEWSRQRGELVQIITGIPYFYRQFGYEMGLELGGSRTGYAPQLPALPEGQAEPYTFRPPQEADLPTLMRLYELECRHSLVSAVRSAADWRYELFEKSAENVNRWEARLIEDAQGQVVGYLVHPGMLWGTSMVATRYGLLEDHSYLQVNPSVIRYLWRTGQALAEQHGKKLESYSFAFGTQHPAYLASAERLPRRRPNYAYFVRVPDVPAFLRVIAPVLEKRLAASPCAGHTGELKISFYRDGVRLQLAQGRIKAIENWQPRLKEDEGDAAFPMLTFLQLLFGYRELPELKYAYADCTASEQADVLLQALFPKQSSSVWAIA